MRTLCIGASWVMKYCLAEILLRDSDDFEQEFLVYDQTQTAEDFFHFPPLVRYAGDERIGKIDDFDGSVDTFYDCIIVDTNIIDDVRRLVEKRAKINPKSRLIILSSGDVYGFQGRRQIPFDEKSTLPLPTSQLGKTKAEIERICAPLQNVAILRLSKIFGPYMPEDDEIIQWLTAFLKNEPILVEQPAARYYDLNYVTNVSGLGSTVGPVEKAMTADLKGERIFNIGSADSDFKEQTLQNPKARQQIMQHEKNVVNLLVGLRHQVHSTSRIDISNENVSVYQGKGYHSQLKTERARQILDYFPMVDTGRGLFQTFYWLQKSGFATGGAPDMEITYPTLRELRESGEVESLDKSKKRDTWTEQKKELGDLTKELACMKCGHIPAGVSTGCSCSCHIPFSETEEALR